MNRNSDSPELKLIDPRGIIQESYLIEGITAQECRSIFFDWAMSSPPGQDTRSSITRLLQSYQLEQPDHPMTQVLMEGLQSSRKAKRRGGAGGRVRD